MNLHPSDIRLPFGRHAGQPLADVPGDYLDWLLRRCRLSAGLRPPSATSSPPQPGRAADSSAVAAHSTMPDVRPGKLGGRLARGPPGQTPHPCRLPALWPLLDMAAHAATVDQHGQPQRPSGADPRRAVRAGAIGHRPPIGRALRLVGCKRSLARAAGPARHHPPVCAPIGPVDRPHAPETKAVRMLTNVNPPPRGALQCQPHAIRCYRL